MALKDIFTMIKADRYTADGCEEIKKAQEAIKEETKDAGLPDGTVRHRKNGDYVKQAGKWVPAPAAKGAKKNGPDMNAEKAKHAEARKDRESVGAKQDLPADLQKQAQEYVAWEKPEVIQRYINNLRKPFSIERDSFKEPDKLAEALEIELKKKTESKPTTTKKWADAKVGLVNQHGVPLSMSSITFGMTPAWAKSHGYSPDDVNGTAAETKLAKQIIFGQDWSNPEEAVKKINDLDFGYNNWKVTEKQENKVKIASKDSLGNVRELTIERPEATPPANNTESKPSEAPKFKSRNTIMLEKKGFKEVEKGGAYPKLHRFEYKSKSGKTYNIYRDIGSDGFFYHVQTPGGFTKRMGDVEEIKKYLDSDGGNWGHAPGPRGLVSRPYTEKDLVKSNNDAAPRQLTGDCKIRIRKSK